MNKKYIILSVAVIFILGAVVGTLTLSTDSKSFSVGTVLEYADQSVVFIYQDTPVIVSNRTSDEDIFSYLNDGDKILLLHDGIQETYPAKTGAYFVLRLAKGEFDEMEKERILGTFFAG